MPGLLRGVARTAVVAGTASHVAGNVHHRQQQKWDNEAQEEYAAQQQAAPAPQPSQGDAIAQLEKLAQLKEQGIITEDEFAAKKKQVLGI